MKRLAVVLIAVVAACVLWLVATTGDDTPAESSSPAGTTPADAASRTAPGETGSDSPVLPANARATWLGPNPDPAFALAGTVVRLSDGSPLAGCTVMAISLDARTHDRVAIAASSVDEAGTFVFGADVAACDPVWLQAQWDSGAVRVGNGLVQRDALPTSDSLLLTEQARESQTEELAVPPPGSRAAVRLVVDTGWLVRGRVITPDGLPMPDVAVSSPGTSPATTKTDAEGRFVLHDLSPLNETVVLLLEAKGWPQGSALLTTPKDTLQKDVGRLSIDRPNVLRGFR